MEVPPLARGMGDGRRARRDPVGSTPARAGNGCGQRHGARFRGKYPRSRGEWTSWPMRLTSAQEVPPLARGMVAAHQVGQERIGSTPARAGNGPVVCSPRAWCRKYPRSRGEWGAAGTVIGNTSEVPPLARGMASAPVRLGGHVGSTPARAGNGLNDLPAPARTRKYPRSRGEWHTHSSIDVIDWEVPPLARGMAQCKWGPVDIPGSTPARAGNGSPIAPR